jgi:tripartite-type tricarboxylate transporter receptor subunit TctC
VKVLAVADLKRNEEFLPDVPTLMEAGIDVDDSSVNFRGLMVPKGTPQEIIDMLAAKIPDMFAHAKVAKQMAAGGSPVKIMQRAEVQQMWADRQAYLTELLAGLK